MSAAIRLALRPVGPIALSHSAPTPLRLSQLNQTPPVLRLAGVMTFEAAYSVQPFEATFPSAASWTVNHNLARRPASVRVLSPGGIEVEAEVVKVSLNQLIVLFAAPQSGRIVVL